MRALFGMLFTGGVGIAVTFIQHIFFPESVKANLEKSNGLTIDTLDQAMINYKGGTKPNHEIGKKVLSLTVTIDESLDYNVVALSGDNLGTLKANDQDMIYISDERWYLGGLRSNHVKVVANKGLNNDVIKMSQRTFDEAYLLEGKKLTAEKIM